MSRFANALRELNEQLNAERQLLNSQEASAAMTRLRIAVLEQTRRECLSIVDARAVAQLDTPFSDRVIDAAKAPARRDTAAIGRRILANW